jgi:U4/U6.U5 tri-snRNP-associated protein 2
LTSRCADVETEGEKVAQYYDLVSNITHDSNAGTAREETSWKTHVHLRPPRDERGRLEGDLTEDDERWFQLEDLNVQEIEKALVPLGPAYIQIWRRRSLKDGEQLRVEVPKQKVKGLAVPAQK